MRYGFGSVLAGALALSAAVAAQNPPAQEPRPQQPATQTQPRAQDQARAVTVEGCLMREADVPGRRPNVAERAGIGEDYILTSTKIIKRFGASTEYYSGPTARDAYRHRRGASGNV